MKNAFDILVQDLVEILVRELCRESGAKGHSGESYLVQL